MGAHAIVVGASSVYVYVLQPLGKGVQLAGTAFVGLLTTVTNTVARLGTEGARFVYIHVLDPTGRAMYVAVVATRDAVFIFCREVQNGALLARNGVRYAVTESVAAFRAIISR